MGNAWSESGEAWARSFAERKLEEEQSIERKLLARRRERGENGAVANVNRWMRELPVPVLLELLYANTVYLRNGERMFGSDVTVQVANDWLLEHGFNSKTPARRRPMTADEKAMVRALAGCSFSAGSFDKRLVRSLDGVAEITDGQARLLPGLCSRYRRQIRIAGVVDVIVAGVWRGQGELPLGLLPNRLGHLLTEETAERARAARERRVHGR